MLTRNRQIAAKIENNQGTYQAPAAADAILVYEPKTTHDPRMQQRNPVRGTLSQEGLIAGMKSLTTSFRVEMRGSGTATVAPEWSPFLRACGYRQRTLRKLTIGAVTGGPFLHMETITQTSSGATGIVIKDTADGTTTLYFIEDFGTAAWTSSDGITGGTSGATATPSAVADAGLSWNPFSKELSKVTIGAVTSGPFDAGEIITGGTSGAKGVVYQETANGETELYYEVIPGTGEFANGETVTGATSGASATTGSAAVQQESPSISLVSQEDQIRKISKGCRGKVRFGANVGEIVMFDFEFMGAKHTIADSVPFSGVSFDTTVPPVFLSAQFTIDSVALALSQINIDSGIELAPRVDANEANGIKSYRITGRVMKGDFNPEMVQVAAHDFYGKLEGNNEMVLTFRVGTTSGNMFEFYAKKAQYEKVDDSDDQGIARAGASFQLNRVLDAGDDELWILAL